MRIASVADFREAARRRLPRFLFDYVDGGSYAEVTLRRNVADLAEVALRQRVLRDVSDLDLSTEILGQKLALPLALGPVGLSGMYARRGEVQAARAAQAAGVQFTLSTVSCCSLDEVATQTDRPIWFQLYITKDRGFTRDMLARAAGHGCPVLLFTVDLPVPGSRYRDVHSGLHAPPGMRSQMRRLLQAMGKPRWAWDVGVRGKPHSLGNIAHLFDRETNLLDFLKWSGSNFDASLTWKDIAALRAQWPGRFVIKGILDPEDARAAADCGVDGIVVSNHGGRQLDGVHVDGTGAPGDRRRGRRQAHHPRRRWRPLRARRGADARARRRRRAARAGLGLCPRRAGRRGRDEIARDHRGRDAGRDGADRRHQHPGAGQVDPRLGQHSAG